MELYFNQVKDFKELEELAAKKEISILVTGQILGDENYKTNLTVMKPLIAYSKKEIEEWLKWYRGLVM